MDDHDTLSDVPLLHAVQAWCDECLSERILVPVVDDLPAVAALRRSA